MASDQPVRDPGRAADHRAGEEDEMPRIGFIATRIAGTDGVSLEADKWAEVIHGEGYEVFYFAGELDTPSERSMSVPLAHFSHPEIRDISRICFGCETRDRDCTRRIQKLKETLKDALYDYLDRFSLNLLVVQNVLSLPMNLPLGLAVSEVIAETGIPTIAHHHDFYWERNRFLVNCVWDYINQAFPPQHPAISHVCINSSASHQLNLRHGLSSTVIPNVFNFEEEPPPPDDYAVDFVDRIGLQDDELLILQPTRVVMRKGIEHSIEFVRRLGRPARFVVSHAEGDERRDYGQRIRDYAELLGVTTVFASDYIDEERGQDENGHKIYSLDDIYPLADLVTYPSDFEGFGNAFLETVYFRKPVVVNLYSVYMIDIRPRGFRTIELDGYVTEEALELARRILDDPDLREEIVAHNFELARKYFSHAVLRRKLCSLLQDRL